MVVFWTGWGILALFVPFVCFPAALLGAHHLGAEVCAWDEMSWLVGSAWMLSGLLCWVLGRLLNGRKPRIIKDPQTGQDVAFRRSHTFLFMEMQWTGVLYGLAGLWFYAKCLWS